MTIEGGKALYQPVEDMVDDGGEELVQEARVNRVVFIDDEGVGRCNLFKVKAIDWHKNSTDPFNGIHFEAMGMRKPASGTTVIHDDVIFTARQATSIHRSDGIDISDWPINTFDPEMMHEEESPSHISDKTVVVWLSEAPVPDEIVQSAFAVLIAHFEDPFGMSNMRERLNRIATMAGYYLWLLEIAISHPDELEKKVKRADGGREARYLIEFEPKGIEPEYSFDGYLTTMHPSNVRIE